MLPRCDSHRVLTCAGKLEVCAALFIRCCKIGPELEKEGFEGFSGCFEHTCSLAVMLSHSAMSWGIISACFLRFSSSWENKFSCQFSWSKVKIVFLKTPGRCTIAPLFFLIFYLSFLLYWILISCLSGEDQVLFEIFYTADMIAEFQLFFRYLTLRIIIVSLQILFPHLTRRRHIFP